MCFKTWHGYKPDIMDQLTSFTYQTGKSFLHMLDVRCKIFSMCLLSLSIIKADFASLALISFIITTLVINAGINPVVMFRELKYFFILLIFVFAARALTTNGTPLIIFFNISMTKQGMVIGARICARFLIIMLLGMVFIKTTKPSSVKGAVQWFLSPVPFIPEKRVSIMISLFLRFMPFLIKQTKQISNAQKSRCADLQPNPIKKAARLCVPLFKKTFQSADRLATAMEARCYSEDRTDPEFIKSGHETIIYLTTLALSIIMILF